MTGVWRAETSESYFRRRGVERGLGCVYAELFLLYGNVVALALRGWSRQLYPIIVDGLDYVDV